MVPCVQIHDVTAGRAVGATCRRRRSRQTGFNFAEVLFAVMILGIGFIMIAAIFPVALVQSKLTQEESTGASVARGAANYIEQIADATTMPPTPNNTVRSIGQMPQVKGKLLLSADSRIAWVPFYRRQANSPYAQLYMIPTAVRNRSAYDKGGVPPVVQAALPGTPPLANAADYICDAVLIANVVDETAAGNTDRVDYIEFPSGVGENDTNENYTTVAEGSYVIISDVTAPAGADARKGHIFRIGSAAKTQSSPTPYPRRWNLVPGYDYVPLAVDLDNPPDGIQTDERPGPLTLNNAKVFVVGRSLADPSLAFNSTTNQRDGTGQEVGAYTTFIQVR